MNETSRGVGDPPIGGFANPSSSTSLKLDSASHAGITSATISSSSIPGDIGGITINHDPRHTDPTLPSLGASLGSDFDAFGADNLNLTKLLGSDSVGSPWGDPFADPAVPSTGGSSASSNQSQNPIRPWELDLCSTGASTQTAASTSGPPNVLAPRTETTLASGLPRPPHHATAAAAQYFHPPVPSPIGQPTYIDQRLPSFQSQFQATADAATAAAFHVPAPHYSALVSPHHAAGAIPPHAMQHVTPGGAATNHQQFLDHHQQALHAGYHHPASTGAHHPHGYPLHPRPHFPPTTGAHSRLHTHLTQPLHHPQQQQQQQQHLVSPQRIVARKSVVDHTGVQSADTTKLSLSRPPSAASSLSGGNTDLMSSQQTPASISATEAAHPTLAAQLRKKTGRAASLEGSDVSGSTDHSSDAPGQVSAISSTDGVAFKPPGATGSAALPHGAPARTSMGRGKAGNQRKQALMMDSHSAGGPGRMGGGSNNGGAGASAVPTPSMDPDKPVKKKRKRCGECTGCQRKDNCGECAPCRNDKSHQICKQRRCERLTEKKPKPGGVGRGQGKKSAGNGEYKPRGRGAGSASNSNNNNSLTTPGQTSTNLNNKNDNSSSAITKMDTSPIPGNRNINTQTGAPNNNSLNNVGGNNNNSSSLLQATQFGGSYASPASSSASSISQPWGGAAPTQSSHQWQQSQNSAQYQPPSQYGQSQFGSNFTPNGQFGAPTSNSGFLPSPNMNSASNAVGSSPGGSAFVGLNGNNQLGGTHHYSLNVNTGPMHTDPKTGYPMASPLGGGSIHASPRGGVLPAPLGGTTNLQQAMSGNSMPGYPHRPAGVSSHNSNQLRSPITSEGYSGDKNRTGISPDTTTKDDYMNRSMHSQNNPYLQQNVQHGMSPSQHYNIGPRQQAPMRSPQQVHSSGGGMGQPPGGHPGRIPQQSQASFLAYSAGDVASMAQNRNQGLNYNNVSSNSSNQSIRGSNYHASYSNTSLPSGASSNPLSSMSDASRNAMNQAYSGGDISRMTDIRADYSKPYSALDRTTSALNDIYGQPNNTARNVPSSSMSGSNPQYPSYSMPAQSNIMSSPAMRTAASIYSNQPKSNLPISNNPNNSSQMYSSQTQQQMNYQQMQQNPPTSQQQYHQSQPNMQAPNSRPTTSMQQNQQVGSTNQAQMSQQPNGGYPKNIPMMALQQQKTGPQLPPPTYHGNIPNVNGQPSSNNASRSPQKQRSVRPFNTPISPSKPQQQAPSNKNLSLLENTGLKQDGSLSKPNDAISKPYQQNIPNNKTIQEPGLPKIPASPTKKKPVQPKTPTKTFLNSNRRDRFASSEESSPLKRIKEGNTSNYAADHEAEMERLGKRFQDESPSCDCMNSSQQALVPDTGPYYVHLGHARTLPELRSLFEGRCGVKGDALRMEKIKYVPREGKTAQGCPVAKYIVRRRNEDEKYLIACKHRLGHKCEYAWTVTLIIAWEGLNRKLADNAYDIFSNKLANFGLETRRQCDSNSNQTCACQGADDKSSGASYTFGCSWSMYFNSCKFAKSSGTVRKFRLDDEAEEEELEDQSHLLATAISPIFKRLAPQSYGNMTAYESLGSDCRIGLKRGRPFSGITTVTDFCAHAHKDRNNMNGGTTVIVTLTRPENRENWRNPDDEQLHVLPHYMPDRTDEFGSTEGQKAKVERGDVNILDSFHRRIGKRNTRNLKCVKKKNQKQVWRSGPNSSNPKGDRKRFLDQYARMEKQRKMEEKGVDSSPLARPLPNNSPKSSIPQVDGNASPAYSSDGDAENETDTIQQLDGVADYYNTGMGQSQNGGMVGTNAYGGSQQYNPSGQYGNQSIQGQMNGHYNTPYSNSQSQMSAQYQQMQSVNGNPSYQYNQQGYNHQAQQMSNTSSQYYPGAGPMNGNPSMVGSPNPYNYQHGSYMPGAPGNYNQMGASQNHSQQMSNNLNQNTQQPAGQSNNPTIPSPPFGSINDFKQQMISIRNEISDEDGVPKEAPKEKDYEPDGSDSDAAGSPFKTPVRKVPPMPSQSKQTTKPESGDRTSSQEDNDFKTPETPDITYEDVDCKEVFGEHNRHIGGLAVSLPHGSLVIECAKAELHATTALKHPNRYKPNRIGMVFYQHKTLNYPHHGQGNAVHTMRQKNERDYQAWKDGLFVPTQRKLQTMIEQGFRFPENVSTIDSGQKLKFEDIEKPDLSFLREGDDGLPAPLELNFADEHAAQKASMPSPPTPDALSPGSQLSPNGVKSPVSPQSKPSVGDIVKEEIKEEVKYSNEEKFKPPEQQMAAALASATTKELPEVKSEEVKKEEIKVEEVKQETSNQEPPSS